MWFNKEPEINTRLKELKGKERTAESDKLWNKLTDEARDAYTQYAKDDAERFEAQLALVNEPNFAEIRAEFDKNDPYLAFKGLGTLFKFKENRASPVQSAAKPLIPAASKAAPPESSESSSGSSDDGASVVANENDETSGSGQQSGDVDLDPADFN